MSKPETAASLRGIAAQLRAAINRSGDNCVLLTVDQANRIHKALMEFERQESILTEPPSEYA